MQRIILDTPDQLHKINDLLSTYRGYPVKLWFYGVSLSQLDLRIDRAAAGNFHLRLGAVSAIYLPQLHWKLGGRLLFLNAGLYASNYEFVDDAASVRIVSGGARLEENVEPLYGWDPSSSRP